MFSEIKIEMSCCYCLFREEYVINYILKCAVYRVDEYENEFIFFIVHFHHTSFFWMSSESKILPKPSGVAILAVAMALTASQGSGDIKSGTVTGDKMTIVDNDGEKTTGHIMQSDTGVITLEHGFTSTDDGRKQWMNRGLAIQQAMQKYMEQHDIKPQ